MTQTPPQGLSASDIQFYDFYQPSLPDGRYEIEVSHAIDDLPNDIAAATQLFTVRGPRFTLNPADVYSQFPPTASSGRYAEKLPHVVLSKRALPWERLLSGPEKHIPWLALLLLEEGELLGDIHSETMTTTSTVADVLKDSNAQIIKPAIGLVDMSIEEQQQLCRTILVNGTTFQRFMPRLRELPYLAHCRQVNTDHKEPLRLKDDGWFSLIIGNRFPRVQNASASGKNIVHLVSLEGLQQYLGDTPPTITEGSRVRLFSLASWSFVCLAEGGQTFYDLAEHFVTQEAGITNRLLLKLPVEPPASNATNSPQFLTQDYLSKGYAALNYQTQTGDATFAWYRGPFVPVVTAPLQKTDHFHTAAAAMIYDQRLGLFDHSLAAAWQIGRSLALADTLFASSLLRFRRQGHALLDLLMERLHSVHLDSKDNLQQLLQSDLIYQRFLDLLKNDLTQKISDSSRQPLSQASPPGRTRFLSGPTPTNPVAALKDLLERDEVKALMGQAIGEELEPIARWLAQLKLLYGVPFHHLVPDVRMLPQESLRFFYVDQNWIEAMIDGALTSGIQTSRDVLFHAMMKDVIGDSVNIVTLQVRAAERGATIDLNATPADTATPISGILLRSALVSGWPGLAIRAHKNGQLLQLLRMERLSPNVMLCLFLDVPDELEISEPQEGLQFGVNEKGEIALRTITGKVGSLKTMLPIYDPRGGTIRGYLRADTDRVLNILAASGPDLATAIAQQLAVGNLTPAEFALQMIRSPEQLTFK